MRHKCGNKKLGRPTDQRIALLRSLAVSLFRYNRIETTVTKAKELTKVAARIITLVKKGDLNSKRKVIAALNHDKKVAKEIFNNVEKLNNRKGGYTRIIRTGNRRGDSADTAIIELVDLVSA